MAKLTLTDLTQLSSNETSAVNAINTNNTAIETALENTLSRDGTAPNTMTADIDLNSNKVINSAAPTANTDLATKLYVDDLVTGGGNVPGPDSGSADDNKILKVNGASFGWEAQAALDVTYDNTASGLSATDVKAAIDELNTIAGSQLWTTITTLTTGTHDIEHAADGTYYLLDTSGGNITINLPVIGTTEGTRFAFMKTNAANTVTINRDSTDTINGGTSYTITNTDELVNGISDDNSPDNWVFTIISQTLAGTGLTKSGSTISINTGGVDTTQLADDSVTPPKVEGAINAQTGTTYTLVLTDAFKTVTFSNAAAVTVTVPTNASVAYTVGDRVDLVGIGAGLVTVTGDAGVTVNGVSAGSGTFTAQYSAASLIKTATDTWLLIGDHGGVA